MPSKRNYELLQLYKSVRFYNTASSISVRKRKARYMLVVQAAFHTRQAV
jgi:hypothetical protein